MTPDFKLMNEVFQIESMIFNTKEAIEFRGITCIGVPIICRHKSYTMGDGSECTSANEMFDLPKSFPHEELEYSLTGVENLIDGLRCFKYFICSIAGVEYRKNLETQKYYYSYKGWVGIGSSFAEAELNRREKKSQNEEYIKPLSY